ncbi:MAG: hypothetical protein KDC52_02085, partial [Ignavibacteriae bacterium]|nr:hypothetical protein [Ignavibacteriota bacterium]
MYLIDSNGYNIVVQNNSLKYAIGHDNYCEFDFRQTKEISQIEYLKAKYGDQNKNTEIINHSYSKLSNGTFVTVNYTKDNLVRLHSPDGEVLKVYENIKSNTGTEINDITVDQNGNIWIVSAMEHFAGQFDVNGDILFKIEGKRNMEPGELDFPEAITTIGEFLYISDMGNRRIAQLDSHTYKLKTYLKVPEPVYQF